MSLVIIPNGIRYPSSIFGNQSIRFSATAGGLSTISNIATIDATNEKTAIIGHVYWSDHGSKTMDSTSKIHFRTATVTFADASTNLRVGLQDVSTTSGPPMQPDGTFDVYRDLPGNNGSELTSATDNTVTSVALSTSGSKTVNHGDLIAVVFDMTARAGSDTLTLGGLLFDDRNITPGSYTNLTGTWAVNAGTVMGQVMLEAADGTFGIISGIPYFSGGSAYDFASTSNPDEIGLIFQVPFKCKIDGAVIVGIGNNAAADATMRLYSTPTGTPTEMASYTIYGERSNNATDDRLMRISFSNEYELMPNTDYCIAIEAIGASNFSLGYITLADANHRDANGYNNCRKGYRTNGSGAFSETTTEIPLMAVNISRIDDGLGGGVASFNIGI